MDPNVHFEHPGLAQDRSHTDETAAYLRRLKAQTEDAPRARADASAQILDGQSSPGSKDRRRSPRFLCSGSVEFKTESDVRMWGTLQDISLHGCYVEMSATFPLNTKASLVIESVGIRFHTQATVRTSYPFLGMGMCFTEIEAEQQSQLKEILAALAGQKALPGSVPPEQSGLPEIVAAADPYACMKELAEFFKKNAALSRDEFYQIAKRACRS